MSAFHNVLLPLEFSISLEVAIGFNTEIIALNSGAEERNAKWPRPRREWALDFDGKTSQELADFLSFYIARGGAEYSFKIIDPLDRTTASDNVSAPSATDVEIGVGDDTEVDFQLKKVYSHGGIDRVDNLLYIEPGTTVVAVNGTPTTAFSVNELTGIVTLDSAPADLLSVRAGCKFYRRARFSRRIDRELVMKTKDSAITSISNVTILEDITDTLVSESFWYGGSQFLEPAVDTQINHLDGRMVTVVPSVADVSIILEDPEALIGGGPYYAIYCPGQSFIIEDHNNNALITAEALKTYEVWLGLDAGLNKIWVVV